MTTDPGRIQRLHEQRRSFQTSDDLHLAYTVWRSSPANPLQRVIAILPGMGAHSGLYHLVAESLALPETLHAALDFRGHGLSGGERGRLAGPGRMEQDVGEWLDDLQRLAPGTPVFLLGESMGSPYALLYALHHGEGLAGLALVSPALTPSWRQLASMDTLRSLADLLQKPSRQRHAIDIAGWRLETSSRDPGFIRERRTDPLALQAVSPDYLAKVGQAILSITLRVSLEVSCPVYIAHGEQDHVVSPFESRLLHLRLKGPAKELDLVPGAYHTLFWDPDSAWFYARLRRWLLRYGR